MNDPNNDYSNQTDITFMLSGLATDSDGISYAIHFPSPVTSAVSSTIRAAAATAS